MDEGELADLATIPAEHVTIILKGSVSVVATRFTENKTAFPGLKRLTLSASQDLLDQPPEEEVDLYERLQNLCKARGVELKGGAVKVKICEPYCWYSE
jgi:hypothetical protein